MSFLRSGLERGNVNFTISIIAVDLGLIAAREGVRECGCQRAHFRPMSSMVMVAILPAGQGPTPHERSSPTFLACGNTVS